MWPACTGVQAEEGALIFTAGRIVLRSKASYLVPHDETLLVINLAADVVQLIISQQDSVHVVLLHLLLWRHGGLQHTSTPTHEV